MPNGGAAGLGGWEPVFHPILGNLCFVYVPGASGTLFKVNKFTGDMITRINLFDDMDPHTFVSDIPVADNRGHIYYNVIQLAAAPNPWSVDVVEAWLIKVDFFDQVSKVRYRDLIPDAPTMCIGSFSPALLPWPPAPEAQPAMIPCGAQRPGRRGRRGHPDHDQGQLTAGGTRHPAPLWHVAGARQAGARGP
jgi:hypothetical protein